MVTATNSLLSGAVLHSAASAGPGSVKLGSVTRCGIVDTEDEYQLLLSQYTVNTSLCHIHQMPYHSQC